MNECMCVCIHRYMHVHNYVHGSVCVCACVCVCVCVCCAYLGMCIYWYAHLCIHMCKCVCICSGLVCVGKGNGGMQGIGYLTSSSVLDYSIYFKSIYSSVKTQMLSLYASVCTRCCCSCSWWPRLFLSCSFARWLDFKLLIATFVSFVAM